MAGHSQFKNIMHRKGRQDAQKSKLFGKLAREITVAAKLGTPDPAMNPRLRAAVTAAYLEHLSDDDVEVLALEAGAGRPRRDQRPLLRYREGGLDDLLARHGSRERAYARWPATNDLAIAFASPDLAAKVNEAVPPSRRLWSREELAAHLRASRLWGREELAAQLRASPPVPPSDG